MIKNKDGSYNKVSLVIISLIVIIGIGIIISSIVPLDTNELLQIIILGSLLGLTGLFIYRIILKRHKHKIHDNIHIIQSTPVIQQKATPFSVIEEQPNTSYESTSGINLVSIIITVIIAAVMMFVGMTVMNSLQSAMPPLPEGSALATQQAALNSTISSAFTIIPLILVVGTIGFIISILFKFTTYEDY